MIGSHSIVGRIRSIRHSLASGKKVSNLDVVVGDERSVPFRIVLWEEMSEMARRLGLEEGQLIFVSLEDIEAETFEDRAGNIRARIRGPARTFRLLESLERLY